MVADPITVLAAPMAITVLAGVFLYRVSHQCLPSFVALAGSDGGGHGYAAQAPLPTAVLAGLKQSRKPVGQQPSLNGFSSRPCWSNCQDCFVAPRLPSLIGKPLSARYRQIASSPIHRSEPLPASIHATIRAYIRRLPTTSPRLRSEVAKSESAAVRWLLFLLAFPYCVLPPPPSSAACLASLTIRVRILVAVSLLQPHRCNMPWLISSIRHSYKLVKLNCHRSLKPS